MVITPTLVIVRAGLFQPYGSNARHVVSYHCGFDMGCGVWTAVVPVPTVSWACQPEEEGWIFCVLTCEGDTSGAEPVQYSWRINQPQANISGYGDADANETLPKSINVTMVSEMQ